MKSGMIELDIDVREKPVDYISEAAQMLMNLDEGEDGYYEDTP